MSNYLLWIDQSNASARVSDIFFIPLCLHTVSPCSAPAALLWPQDEKILDSCCFFFEINKYSYAKKKRPTSTNLNKPAEHSHDFWHDYK